MNITTVFKMLTDSLATQRDNYLIFCNPEISSTGPNYFKYIWKCEMVNGTRICAIVTFHTFLNKIISCYVEPEHKKSSIEKCGNNLWRDINNIHDAISIIRQNILICLSGEESFFKLEEKPCTNDNFQLIKKLIEREYPDYMIHKHYDCYLFYLLKEGISPMFKLIEYSECKYGHFLTVIGNNIRFVLMHENINLIVTWLEMIFLNTSKFIVKTTGDKIVKLSNIAFPFKEDKIINTVDYFLLSYDGSDTIIGIDVIELTNIKLFSVLNKEYNKFICELQSHYIFNKFENFTQSFLNRNARHKCITILKMMDIFKNKKMIFSEFTECNNEVQVKFWNIENNDYKIPSFTLTIKNQLSTNKITKRKKKTNGKLEYFYGISIYANHINQTFANDVLISNNAENISDFLSDLVILLKQVSTNAFEVSALIDKIDIFEKMDLSI